MTASDFMKKQNATLLHDFSEFGYCVVAAAASKLPDMQRFEDWEIEKLPGCRSSSALIIRKRPTYEAECWVRWDYRGYRKAFAAYLDAFYPEYSCVLNPSLHVDHLEPRFRFRKGDNYFVRLHLVSSKVNSSYGAGFEQGFYQTERTKPLDGVVHLSWLGFCKAKGTLLPGKNSGASAWEQWARTVARIFSEDSGELASHAYVGLLAFLQLGYTRHYAGRATQLDYESMLKAYDHAHLAF